MVIDLREEEFGYPGTARVMMLDKWVMEEKAAGDARKKRKAERKAKRREEREEKAREELKEKEQGKEDTI